MQDKILANAKSFPERLKAVLDLRGLTAVEVAQGIDSAHSTVYRMLEPGGSKPQLRTLKRLADFLRVRKEWLADGVGKWELSERESSLAEVRVSGGNQLFTHPNIREDVPGEIIGHLDKSIPLPPDAMPVRWVPVVGWAHAGVATCYEEIPLDWQDLVPIPVIKGKVIALRIQGDSMEPRCLNGDLVILLPESEAQTGDLVVAKFKDNGIVLRRLSVLEKHRVRLTAYNPVYPATEHLATDFHWIYPVHSSMRFER